MATDPRDEPRFQTNTGRWMTERDLDELAEQYAPGGERRHEVDQAIEQWIAETVANLDHDDPEIRRVAEDTIESLRRYHGQ